MDQSKMKKLNLWDAVMLVVGSMIGSGIFIVSADMSRTVGSSGWLLFLWLLSGLITILAALSYGELAGMMPKAGGQFVYIQRAWGNIIAFLYGWTVFTVIQTGVIAAVAVAFAKYSGVFFPSIAVDNLIVDVGFLQISTAQVVAICLIVFLTYINTKGIQNGKIVQSLFTLTKILALVFIIVLGIYKGFQLPYFHSNFQELFNATSTSINSNSELNTIDLTGFALILALGTAIIGSLFSSDAWNNVTFVAGEIDQPQKNIPRSLIIGTTIVTILYCLANVAYLGLLPMDGNPSASDVVGQGIKFASNDRVGTAAASMIFDGYAIFFMAALIMISTFGCNNGIILSGARVYYAMSKEGLFFKKVGALNQYNVPQNALIAQAIWASVLCLSGTYGDLLDYVTFASLLFYIVTIIGVFLLRKKEPDAPRPYKALGYPLIPMLYILLASSICLILLYTKPQNTWSGIFLVLLGLPIYYLMKKKNSAVK